MKVMLTILTLNLHTWQEPDQLAKFDRIADFIAANGVDIVCFQECAQHRDAPLLADGVLREDNAAHLMRERLRSRGLEYGLAWDWAHYGWSQWEEGVAVLSRLPMTDSASRWVSESRSRTDALGSRKVLRVRVEVPGFGPVDAYSAHLSWASAGLPTQVAALLDWIDDTETGAAAVIVAGDFNDEPGGVGYEAMRAAGFGDACEAAPPDSAPTAFVTTTWKTRIDHVWTRPGTGRLVPDSTRIVFTGDREPIVSDHFGVLARFESGNR